MKTKLIIAAGALAMLMTGCDQLCPSKTAPAKTTLVTQKDTNSYAFGAHFANQVYAQLVARDSIDLDLDLFIQAFKDRFNHDSSKYLMDDSTVIATLMNIQQQKQDEMRKKDSIATEKRKSENEAFLASNKTAEGVVTTESGLQYKVITEGTGATPGDSDIVKVHYTGSFLDGNKFDSSIDRGEPLEFPINAVIPGWTEMLKLMKVGEKVTAWIPYTLAYGPYGRPPQIPGYSMLVFEMELIDTHAPEAPKAEPAAAPAAPAKAVKPAAAPKAEAKPAAKPSTPATAEKAYTELDAEAKKAQ